MGVQTPSDKSSEEEPLDRGPVMTPWLKRWGSCRRVRGEQLKDLAKLLQENVCPKIDSLDKETVG